MVYKKGSTDSFLWYLDGQAFRCRFMIMPHGIVCIRDSSGIFYINKKFRKFFTK